MRATRLSALLACLSLVLVTAEPGAATENAGHNDSAENAQAGVTIAHVELSGSLGEGPRAADILFGTSDEDLRTLIGRLDQAAEDEDVSGLVLRIDSPDLGWGRVNELRAAIGRVREAGKQVYALIDSGRAADYLVAISCDRVIMPASGSLMLTGVRAEVSFYAGLLDMLGIEADMIQVGDYKGAAEPYTRTEMSDEFRAEITRIVDDYYEQLVETIAEARGMEPAVVEALIDTGPFTARRALALGLIDHVAYADEAGGLIAEGVGAEEFELDEDYAQAASSSNNALAQMMQMMMGGSSSRRRSLRPKVAVIYCTGMIMTGESTDNILTGPTMGSETIIEAIRSCNEDDTVRAIVLRVDSPGGSALASDLIWREVSQCDKPVVVSMGDTAASGGYYISMGADYIFAEPGTLTGSIGVVGGKLALEGLFEMVGINTEVVSRGRNAGILSSTTPFTDSERQVMLEIMRETYDDFVAKAAEGRRLTCEEIEPLAGGRVWTGREAAENGLVDELGTLEDAIAHALDMAGWDPEDEIERLVLPEPPNPFDSLFGGGLGLAAQRAVESQVSLPIPPQIVERLNDFQLMAVMLDEPVLAVMPFGVRVE